MSQILAQHAVRDATIPLPLTGATTSLPSVETAVARADVVVGTRRPPRQAGAHRDVRQEFERAAVRTRNARERALFRARAAALRAGIHTRRKLPELPDAFECHPPHRTH
jgi:hypothetical protein